ncbi:MAG: heptosyltransferase-2 [Candidatus Pseudothioglobus sp.]|jgi:heptosyltransferase-2
MERTTQRLLVVSPSWVGDMVMAQTLLKTLKQRQPDRLIDVLAPAATLAIASRMPEVNDTLLFEVGHGQLNLPYRRKIAGQLRHRDYDQAIVMPNSLKSALVPWLADIPIRTGFRGEYRYGLINDMRLLDKARLPRMVDRFNNLGGAINAAAPPTKFPALSIDPQNQQDCLAKLGLIHSPSSPPILGLCPGAEFGDAKRWPAGHYAAVADMAVQQGMQVWIFGGPADALVASEIKNLVAATSQSQVEVLAGKTRLVDAIDLMSLCQLVVSNDSGLMHIAAAVNCPTAVVYGSTSPSFTPPLTDKLHVVSLALDCSPCFKRTCPLGHKDCLNKLWPSMLAPVIAQYAAA